LRKLRILAAGLIAVGSLFVAAPSASAAESCDTELGDMCKAISVTCDNVYRTNPKVWALTFCRDW
jgi:hypothetical protein